MNEKEKFTCPKCKGRGELPLPLHLQKTLDVLRKNPESTVIQLRNLIDTDLSVTAINNRLNNLEDRLFAFKERGTSGYVWSSVGEK